MIGSTVSHYRILERLGGGGMGVVYKALDLKLDRFVALKFLSAQRSATDEYKRRFAREAKAASALDHPNICTVYDIDETKDGHLFIAMALCEGETLKRKIERGPLAVDEAVDIAVQVAAGLAQAHARGIVHRDVKPGNVIVAPDGSVKLVDFGIAKLADQSRITRVGTAVGTAAYMAPEQFRDEPIDSRVDIWALGVLFYEMLTSHLPYDDEDEKELIKQILTGEPQALRSRREGIPEGLERVISKALAKRPADRYLQMEEMRTDLIKAAGGTDSWSAMEPTVIDVPGRPLSSATHPTHTSVTSLVGRTIARYRVVEHLGGGGMGVIYKAEDTQLARIVALKFLPPELVRDPDAKARFLQEARSASSLEHPNICTIHEIGEDDEGRLYIVMPCYDGETLRRKIERGPLPVDEATDIAQQLARGLYKAHRAGIVHRDIKPANLVVTSDGVVKILDFGLAKLAGSLGLTRTGSSLGTPAYMSPEQAQGEPVDHRADLWSLGVVLYEMLAGRRPFRGDHDQAILYSILNEEPQPLSQTRVDVPQELQRIIDGLLKKNVAERFPSIDGPLLALRAMRNEPLTGTLRMEITDTGVSQKQPAGWRTWAMAAGLLAGVALAVWAVVAFLKEEPVPQFQMTQVTDEEGREAYPSLAPDGSAFVYTRWNGENADIYYQRIGGGSATNLTGGSKLADTHPAISPDSKQIAFRSERDGGGLFLMGLTGESVTRLTTFGYDPAWSPDGKEIVFATESIDTPSVRRTTSQIWKVDLATRQVTSLKTPDAVQPSYSPKGLRIAFWGLDKGSAQRMLWTVKVDGTDARKAVADDYVNWNPVWAPNGKHLYFASDRSGIVNLWRVAIDEGSGEVSGEPQGVTSSSSASAFPSFSRDGKLILYVSSDTKSNIEKAPLDFGADPVVGPATQLTQGVRSVGSVSVSPDGRWIAYYSTAPQEDIYVVGADGTGLRQLTNDRANDRSPQWSPDGKRLAFYSYRPDRYQIWSIPAEGGVLEQMTDTQDHTPTLPLWSPDGTKLAVNWDVGESLVDLSLPLAQRRPVPIPIKEPKNIRFYASSWSPDGRFLAGELSTADTETAVGVGYYELATGKAVLLANHGRGPVWLHDNRGLLFTYEGKVMAVDRETKEVRLVLSPPSISAVTAVAVSPDGKNLYTVRSGREEDVFLLTFQ